MIFRVRGETAEINRDALTKKDSFSPCAEAPLDSLRALIAESAERADRDPASIGMEGRVDVKGTTDDTVRGIERWRAEGATHVSINTMSAGLGSVGDHLGALEAVAARLPLD